MTLNCLQRNDKNNFHLDLKILNNLGPDRLGSLYRELFFMSTNLFKPNIHYASFDTYILNVNSLFAGCHGIKPES